MVKLQHKIYITEVCDALTIAPLISGKKSWHQTKYERMEGDTVNSRYFISCDVLRFKDKVRWEYKETETLYLRKIDSKKKIVWFDFMWVKLHIDDDSEVFNRGLKRYKDLDTAYYILPRIRDLFKYKGYKPYFVGEGCEFVMKKEKASVLL